MANIGYTNDVRKVMTEAQNIARRIDSALSTEHILGAMLLVEDTYANDILTQLKIDKDRAMTSIAELRVTASEQMKEDQVRRARSLAATIADKMGYDLYDTQHLLLGIAWDPGFGAAKVLNLFGIGRQEIKSIVESMSANGIGKNDDDDDDAITAFMRQFDDIFGQLNNLGMRSGNSSQNGYRVQRNSGAQPKKDRDELDDELKAIGFDMTAKARAGEYDPVIGRDKEIKTVMRVLTRRTKNNPVIIGEPGVGKTAIVEGLAQAIVKNEVPDLLKNKRIFGLDIGALLAGTKYRGEFEQRFKDMFAKIDDGRTILFIDEMHMIMSAGANDESGATIANLLKPLLARGDIPTIGATTMDEYRKYIEKDAALARRFKPITIEPPSVEDTITILKGLRERYETHHNVKITDEALVAAATLSDRYITDRFPVSYTHLTLPTKA